MEMAGQTINTPIPPPYGLQPMIDDCTLLSLMDESDLKMYQFEKYSEAFKAVR